MQYNDTWLKIIIQQDTYIFKCALCDIKKNPMTQMQCNIHNYVLRGVLRS